MSRLRALTPDRITRYTVAVVWANLVVNIGIVFTGGLVRLTGSGLGCPTWPLCTPGSLVPTPEMGIHGVIEYGNRTLTAVLCVVALLAFLAVMRLPRDRGLFAPALTIGILIILQAVIGGATVLLHLDPRIVGVHFYISALIVALATLLLVRVQRNEPRPTAPAPRPLFPVAVVVVVLGWIAEAVGVLATGAGPHAGDSAAARNGLDTEIMHHVHAVSGYVLAAGVILLFVVAYRGRFAATVRATLWLAAVIAVQIAFGVYQARTGLPIWSVAIHMVLAVVVVAHLTSTVMVSRREQPHRA